MKHNIVFKNGFFFNGYVQAFLICRIQSKSFKYYTSTDEDRIRNRGWDCGSHLFSSELEMKYLQKHLTLLSRLFSSRLPCFDTVFGV